MLDCRLDHLRLVSELQWVIELGLDAIRHKHKGLSEYQSLYPTEDLAKPRPKLFGKCKEQGRRG